MAKTISLTDLIVTYLHIDYTAQCVNVSYQMLDADGKKWSEGQAIFWVTIPNQGNNPVGDPLPIPDNWFQLPASYLPTLIALRDDADAALSAKFLI